MVWDLRPRVEAGPSEEDAAAEKARMTARFEELGPVETQRLINSDGFPHGGNWHSEAVSWLDQRKSDEHQGKAGNEVSNDGGKRRGASSSDSV